MGKLQAIDLLIDSREKRPLPFGEGVTTKRKSLDMGVDYSLRDYERWIGISRKSRKDFITSCGKKIKTFFKHIDSLATYEYRLLVVESSYEDLLKPLKFSKVHPNVVIGVLVYAMRRGVPVVFIPDRKQLAQFVERFMRKCQ